MARLWLDVFLGGNEELLWASKPTRSNRVPDAPSVAFNLSRMCSSDCSTTFPSCAQGCTCPVSCVNHMFQRALISSVFEVGNVRFCRSRSTILTVSWESVLHESLSPAIAGRAVLGWLVVGCIGMHFFTSIILLASALLFNEYGWQ